MCRKSNGQHISRMIAQYVEQQQNNILPLLQYIVECLIDRRQVVEHKIYPIQYNVKIFVPPQTGGRTQKSAYITQQKNTEQNINTWQNMAEQIE